MANPRNPKRRSGGQPPAESGGTEPAAEHPPPIESSDDFDTEAAAAEPRHPEQSAAEFVPDTEITTQHASGNPPHKQAISSEGETVMAEHHDEKVYPSGLTMAEAEELHKYLWQGTKIFGAVSLVAHLLTYASSPWLH
jgi:light-harvesting protein B-800-850 beta chain